MKITLFTINCYADGFFKKCDKNIEIVVSESMLIYLKNIMVIMTTEILQLFNVLNKNHTINHSSKISHLLIVIN